MSRSSPTIKSNKAAVMNASDKLAELVVHISEMSAKDPLFASTKLNELVWASDFQAFCDTGRTITGASYQREKFGPVPRAMLIVLSALQKEKRLSIQSVTVGSKTANRPVATTSANLTPFSYREISIVGKVVAENFGKTGTKMSQETHERLAWKVLDDGKTIPFYSWLVISRKPNHKEKTRAVQLEKELAVGV